jgi:ectoine hydroxylase-related dioxygenase (phytanoyl-CoA dioxygenase family)
MALHDQQVSQLERDLRFYPVVNPAPRTVTPAQIAAYNAGGYLSGFRAFTGPEVVKNRAASDRVLDRFIKAGLGSYAIDRWHDRIETIYDLATAPAILDVVEDIVGPNIICWATHYFCKMPGDDMGVAWHQDCSYWALTPSKTVTVWLAIDDADVENGCMRVIPGSHLRGHIAFRESEAGERNVLTQTIVAADSLGTPVNVELKAGEFSLHSDLLVHGSLPNRSHRRRCGLTLRYCSPDVHAHWDWNTWSIICRGADPSGHWANISRPATGFDFSLQ